MTTKRPGRSGRVAIAMIVAVTALATGLSQNGAAEPRGLAGPKPTVVLVHGAWADSSGWAEVTRRLQDEGCPVLAPGNPLRGLTTTPPTCRASLPPSTGRSSSWPLLRRDGDHQRRRRQPEHHGTRLHRRVRTDTGDTLGGLGAMNPGSGSARPPRLRPHPTGLDVYIAPTAFRRVFAEDVSSTVTAVMAATQRPIDASALGEPSGPRRGRRRRPGTWWQPETAPSRRRRSGSWLTTGATTVEVRSSHAAMVAKPGPVADLILSAANSTN